MTPDNLRYSQDHMWVLVNGNIATIGITAFAQKQLSDIVFVELFSSINKVEANDSFGTVESVKAVIDLFTPISGEVTETNESIKDDPEILNEDPYGEGWMVKIKMSSPDEVKNLMTAKAYDAFCAAEN
ncbi:glycine cleavage system protein GcvH [Chitinophaga sp. RAB17]|uniref:glycine cleavage system protein GcvH n=1 Tax=Chitinophaga sp. RAB17 TaxID=3233049 RepID=UPI003F90B9A8